MTPKRLPGVTIVGGGIASLLLGCELAARRRVTLITADRPARAGGHLASWDEGGYPVEHGFHSLFTCYTTALPLLERHGVLGRFVLAPDHFFLDDGVRPRRVRNGWRNLLPPLSWRARLRGVRGAPAALAALAGAARGDASVLSRLDGLDFRQALRRWGFGPELVDSSLIRMFYDFGFTGAGRLSAAVAMGVLSRLLDGGRMLHFPGPSREVLIDPLRRRFESLGGRVLEATRAEALVLDGDRVSQLSVRDPDGAPRELSIEELVLAVDLPAFQRLQWRGGPRPAFAAAAAPLEALSSLSLQLWFDEEPTPRWLDQVVGGLPEPWSTLCPVSRVRGGGRPELIACGPESGFEQASDAELVSRALAMLVRLGVRLPAGRRGMHIVLRRNRAPGERYLATRPGELSLRPSPLTPLPNLYLAGAWTRVPFAMPSIEAAAQSVSLVRDALERRRPSADLRTTELLRPTPRPLLVASASLAPPTSPVAPTPIAPRASSAMPAAPATPTPTASRTSALPSLPAAPTPTASLAASVMSAALATSALRAALAAPAPTASLASAAVPASPATSAPTASRASAAMPAAAATSTPTGSLAASVMPAALATSAPRAALAAPAPTASRASAAVPASPAAPAPTDSRTPSGFPASPATSAPTASLASAALSVAPATGAVELAARAPAYPPPPYRHAGTLRLFRLRADASALAMRIPLELALAGGWSRHLVALVTDYMAWSAPAAPAPRALRDRSSLSHLRTDRESLGERFPAHELMLAAVVRVPGGRRAPGLFPLAVFVDSEAALAAGRELYGFPKQLASVALRADSLCISSPSPAAAHPLVRASWQRACTAERALDRLWPTPLLMSALERAGGLALYNRAPAPRAGGPTLTRALASEVFLGTPTRLTAARFALDATPHAAALRALLPRGASALEGSLGVELPLAFSLSAPALLGATPSPILISSAA